MNRIHQKEKSKFSQPDVGNKNNPKQEGAESAFQVIEITMQQGQGKENNNNNNKTKKKNKTKTKQNKKTKKYSKR